MAKLTIHESPLPVSVDSDTEEFDRAFLTSEVIHSNDTATPLKDIYNYRDSSRKIPTELPFYRARPR